MPRKFIKRWSPDPHSLKSSSRLRFLGKLLHDPNLFHLTRHSVSTACFVGLFVCFFPLPVGHLPIVAALSLWLRCNLPIAFVLVMISNPLTFPFIYYAAYLVGSWILNIPIIDFHFEPTWEWFEESFKDVWAPIVVGNFTLGLLSGGLSYLAVQWIWRWQVSARWRSRKQRIQKNGSSRKA